MPQPPNQADRSRKVYNRYSIQVSQEELDALAVVLSRIKGTQKSPAKFIKRLEGKLLEHRNIDSQGLPVYRPLFDGVDTYLDFPDVTTEEPPLVIL